MKFILFIAFVSVTYVNAMPLLSSDDPNESLAGFIGGSTSSTITTTDPNGKKINEATTYITGGVAGLIGGSSYQTFANYSPNDDDPNVTTITTTTRGPVGGLLGGSSVHTISNADEK